jgi:hypothetical protein
MPELKRRGYAGVTRAYNNLFIAASIPFHEKGSVMDLAG